MLIENHKFRIIEEYAEIGSPSLPDRRLYFIKHSATIAVLTEAPDEVKVGGEERL